ncbi:DNA polymerase I [Acidocella sp. KAb 2-4]|uniref:DNA polymerase I n=1 Tax=Acidocella sp. KAb 2-4 TaxID=2885158 RepID=UPI001D06A8C7|nr:DNA polymerase I [Acidocella sp. KAb 2-4]MCB5944470.1 DNA polymerase I [Acidocella sp. KAb 2-4]
MRLVLVDGSGFIFRAFHALPDMTRPDGVHVNAVFGFCNMLARLLKEHSGTHIAVVFDAGRHTFRNRIYGEYKAHRPPPPPELVPQFALIREATRAFGVPAVELADWEADDLIAAYAKAATEAGGEAVIVSSDKDLMQLLRPGVSMLDPMKNTPIGLAEVEAKFGVAPEKVVEVQALIGDPVDNVPGVPGIGPKGAAALINEYGSLEQVLDAAPAMKPSKRREALLEHAAAARLSRELVVLRDDAPLPAPVESFAVQPWDPAVLREFLVQNNFRSLRHRLGLEGEAQEEAPPPVSAAAFGPYAAITTRAALEALVAQARASGLLALAVQTATPGALHGDLVGLGLATGAGEAAYLPLAHELILGDAPHLSLDEAKALLAPLLAEPGVLKIFHDAKQGLEVLRGAGLAEVAPLDDVMLVSYAQDAGNFAHDAATLARVHLNHTATEAESATGSGRARVSFAAAKLDQATAYAAEAADVALRLWQALKPMLRAHKSLALYELVEKKLIAVLADMEAHGVMVDRADLAAMSTEFEGRMAQIEAEIHRLAGQDFNVGSPKQLGEILFETMGLPGGKKGKTGAWGTDSSVLEGLAEQGVEIAQRVMDWRQLAKLKSTYADALIGQIDPRTGRVHTSFQMAATTTGRLSSTDPNLQNIPIRTQEGARIRKAFIAAPGHSLISADYSQIELRLLAHVADIPALKESFAKGEDIHARTASEVFGVPMEGMDALTRRRAKAINFGIIYGISAFGLGRQLGIAPGEARAYIDAYFQRYPEIRAYMEAAKEQARTHGYVLTPFGRRCWVPKIKDKIPSLRAYAERQAINAPLQGGGADIIKRAMVKLPSALRAAGLKARLILQVHDELLFEAPDDEAEAAAALARQVMQNAAELSVPLVVETGTGKNWGKAH